MSEDGYRRRGRAVRKRKTISGAPPGPRRADQRRAAIVDAAAKLFVEKGFQATTVDDIATQAGFAKGTFYHYFPTKLELLDALRDRFSDEFQDRTRAAADACAQDDWTGRLRSWIEEAVAAYFDMSALHDVVFHGAEMPLRHAMGDVPVVRDLAQLLIDGTAAGAWDVAEPGEVAVIMFHGLHGAADEAMVTAGDADRIGALLSSLYIRMIGARI